MKKYSFTRNHSQIAAVYKYLQYSATTEHKNWCHVFIMPGFNTCMKKLVTIISSVLLWCAHKTVNKPIYENLKIDDYTLAMSLVK